MSEEPIGKEECARSMRYVHDTLYVLGGKWKLPLILGLMQTPMRFNELQRELAGISPKTLAKELKDLELNDFVRRSTQPGNPGTVIYEATEYSHTLRALLRELRLWGWQHREKVKQSMRKGSTTS
ncbi:MAG: transcriptional regulator [Sphingobacteriales bacterium]|nr:MAG: transcriptional regulator [Sphingobacteriales bacterium]